MGFALVSCHVPRMRVSICDRVCSVHAHRCSNRISAAGAFGLRAHFFPHPCFKRVRASDRTRVSTRARLHPHASRDRHASPPAPVSTRARHSQYASRPARTPSCTRVPGRNIVSARVRRTCCQKLRECVRVNGNQGLFGIKWARPAMPRRGKSQCARARYTNRLVYQIR